MLPRSTVERKEREIKRGKPDARGTEIARLIGRALRAAVDMQALGERTVTIDCDVLQADGGTRCASITGGMVALAEAVAWLRREGRLTADPIKQFVAAESPKKPLSDSQIADMLKEQGIECARRTVAKYREALRIPTATLRKAL